MSLFLGFEVIDVSTVFNLHWKTVVHIKVMLMACHMWPRWSKSWRMGDLQSEDDDY